ncbi:MAG: ABC transporter ATP-binding protein [Pseudomonadota bacterium]|jgi:putative ABC transport system ATP-binding protein
MGSAPIVEAIDLARSFVDGDSLVEAVRGITFEVRQGDFIGLVGPSGCGKSTLLNMLGLIETPTRGEVVFEGRSLAAADEEVLRRIRMARVGYVFQAFNLLSTMNVLENVILPCLLVGLTEQVATSRARSLLEDLKLSHRANAMPATLSGGELQRVAVVRAVAHQPAIILADEPTGNLDSIAGEAVLDLLTSINKGGTPIVMATHSESAWRRCSRVIRMRDGAVVSDD